MPSYISSNANRFYTALESSYGRVSSIEAAHRFPAVKLVARHQWTRAERKDKTGSRTFPGVPVGGRRHTTFELKTYMTSWLNQTQPAYGALFQAGLGGSAVTFSGGTAGSRSGPSAVSFATPHGLVAGQGIVYGDEIRFVAAIRDTTTVQLNAPFSNAPAAGDQLGRTVTYFPATELRSVSIFDYWTPSSAVQRLLCGAAVDRIAIRVNGDYHEFEFTGLAQDLVDSSSFRTGLGQLTSFPSEPALGFFDYSIIPGHMGQAWIGSTPDRFFTITNASFLLENDISPRANEFGSDVPRHIAPGRRSVSVDFDLYEQDDSATKGLYQASRQQSPVPIMFQLGQQSSQLVGVYLKSVLPQIPEFDDNDNRLQWRFRNSRAQGTADDEIAIAFG